MHLSPKELSQLISFIRRLTAAPLFVKVFKITGILFTWIAMNFIYGFADYSQDRVPTPTIDYWGYYGFTALYSAFFCFILYRQEREPAFCLAWKWLCVSFIVWFGWQIYAAFYGVSINEKYISTSLFYFNSVAFGVVMLWHPVKSLLRRMRNAHGIEEEDLGM